MADRFTTEQRAAIERRGGSILVGAAAGSGKTTVLAERIVSLLADEREQVDAAKLLVLTFTVAAAAEMRQRIKKRLSQRIAADPTNSYLKKQQHRLRLAQISTVHSFCAALIRDNFAALDIPPDFAVGDEDFVESMKQQAMQQAMEECYGEDAEGMERLAANFGRSRSDREVSEAIQIVCGTEQDLVFPLKWREECIAQLESCPDPDGTAWGRATMEYVEKLLNESRTIAVKMLQLLDEDDTAHKTAQASLEGDFAAVTELGALLSARDFDGFAARLAVVSHGTLRFSKGGDPDMKQQVKTLRATYKGNIEKIQKSALAIKKQQREEMAAEELSLIKTLFFACSRYSECLWKIKLERRFFEFGDLETLAIKLLRNDDGSVSEQAKELSKSFDYIFVDEFQDTNERQKSIFDALSKGGKNLFCVGDVKQSIYSFRHADPFIFTDMRAGCYDAEAGLYPAYLALHKNFRSSRPVIDAVNSIFEPLMKPDFGGVDYANGEQLEKGEIEGQPEIPDEVGLEFYTLSSSATELAGEVADYIAAQLAAGTPVLDANSFRPCREEDFCVLLRSSKNIAPEYQKQLALRGIKSSGAADQKYFDCSEVMTLIALLKVIDNPRRDVELLAVMMSPLFGFTADDMARLRVEDRKACLWALVLASEEEKFVKFKQTISEFRAAASRLGVDELVEKIITETAAEIVLTAPPETSVRRARIRALITLASQHTAYGGRGLGDFIRYCDNAARRTNGGPQISAAAGEGVTVCTIHKSKGLEWPFVILADASKKFNIQDSYSSTILSDTKLGVGIKLCRRQDDNVWMEQPSVYRAVSQKVLQQNLAENMRVLYVALTRARQKAAIFAAVEDKKDMSGAASLFASAESEFMDGALLPMAASRAINFADWVAMAYTAAGFTLSDTERPSTVRRFLSLVTETETGEKNSVQAETEQSDADIAALRDEINARLSFRYKATPLTTLPTKLAVTEYTHKNGESVISKPSFARGGSLSAAERGTALHNFMQLCSYEAAAADADAELKRLRAGRYLDDAAADSINTEQVKNFFNSELGRRVLSCKNVLREYAFIDSVRAGDILDIEPAFADEQVLVQGIADCVLVEDGSAIIIDYKTDRVSNGEELKQRYSSQLYFYRRSIAKRLGVPVSGCVLWSFKLGEAVWIND